MQETDKITLGKGYHFYYLCHRRLEQLELRNRVGVLLSFAHFLCPISLYLILINSFMYFFEVSQRFEFFETLGPLLKKCSCLIA